jgi:hypothetical protein
MMATGAQARVMHGTAVLAGRELKEEDKFDLPSLSISLSMPNEELATAELAFMLDAGSNYTAAEQQQFKEHF